MPQNIYQIALAIEQICYQNESQRRAAASRYYYAAYHFAHHFHSELDHSGAMPSSGTGTHQQLIYQLKNPKTQHQVLSKQSKTIGKILEKAKRIRVHADYWLNTPTFTIHNLQDIKNLVQQMDPSIAQPVTVKNT